MNIVTFSTIWSMKTQLELLTSPCCDGGQTTRALLVSAAAGVCVRCVSGEKLHREDMKNKRKVSDSSMISPSACLSLFVHQQNKSHQHPSIRFFLFFAGLLVCVRVFVVFFFPWSQSTQDGFSRDFWGISNGSLSAAALTPTSDTASHPETSR